MRLYNINSSYIQFNYLFWQLEYYKGNMYIFLSFNIIEFTYFFVYQLQVLVSPMLLNHLLFVSFTFVSSVNIVVH